MTEPSKPTINKLLARIGLQFEEIKNHEEWQQTSPELKDQLDNAIFQHQLLLYLWMSGNWAYKKTATEDTKQ